jgi:hypothetical protein
MNESTADLLKTRISSFNNITFVSDKSPLKQSLTLSTQKKGTAFF